MDILSSHRILSCPHGGDADRASRRMVEEHVQSLDPEVHLVEERRVLLLGIDVSQELRDMEALLVVNPADVHGISLSSVASSCLAFSSVLNGLVFAEG